MNMMDEFAKLNFFICLIYIDLTSILNAMVLPGTIVLANGTGDTGGTGGTEGGCTEQRDCDWWRWSTHCRMTECRC